MSLSILFLVALFYFLVGPPDAYQPPGYDHVVKATGHSLLPGVALGVAAAVVLAQVLLLASKTAREEISKSPAKKLESTMKSKSPGRPKRKEPEDLPAPHKPGGKRENEAKVSSPAEGAATT